tara:strand:- start:1478 stop:2170 length:693 start_codon:yes stop_codon:yes gene_type:complete
MNKADIEFLLSQNIQIDTNNFFLNIFVAIVLSFFIQITYNKTAQTLSSVKNFSNSFIILGLTTAIIITIVKSSLALSLGLVGALSIVRFRAAIKEPEELVYLFLIIAIGLGCGAGRLIVTSLGTFTAILIIFILKKFRTNDSKLNIDNFNVSIVSKKKLNSTELKAIIDVVSNHCESNELISISQNSDGTNINLFSKFKKLSDIEKLDKNFQKKFPKLEFVLLRENSNVV